MRVRHLSIASAVAIPRNNTVITILKGTKKLLYSGRGTRKNLICMRFSAVFRFLFTALARSRAAPTARKPFYAPLRFCLTSNLAQKSFSVLLVYKNKKKREKNPTHLHTNKSATTAAAAAESCFIFNIYILYILYTISLAKSANAGITTAQVVLQKSNAVCV